MHHFLAGSYIYIYNIYISVTKYGCPNLCCFAHCRTKSLVPAPKTWPGPLQDLSWILKDIQISINLHLVGGIPTPLNNISQLGWISPIYGKIKVMFQTTNQPWIFHGFWYLPQRKTRLHELQVGPLMVHRWAIDGPTRKGSRPPGSPRVPQGAVAWPADFVQHWPTVRPRGDGSPGSHMEILEEYSIYMYLQDMVYSNGIEMVQ